MTVRPRVALVGCGWFACEAHVPALKRLESEGRIEVVALCSRSDAPLARATKAFGRTLKTYRRLDEVLADPAVDLVDLVLPIGAMPAAIAQALQAGKHVISEKPCAPRVAEASRLIDLHAGLPDPPLWAVAENWRFKPATAIVEQAVKSGAIGTLHFADFNYMTFAGPDNLGWRGAPDYQGGFLLDSGVHFTALLRQVAGEVDEVSASVSQRLPHLPPADSVTAVLAFARGAEGSFRLSFAARRTPDRATLRLVGSTGAIDADFHRNRIEIRSGSGTRSIAVANDQWVPGGVYEQLAHCVAALRGEVALRSTAQAALRDVALIEAMLEAGRTHRPVRPDALHPVLHGCNHPVPTYSAMWPFRPRHVVDCASAADVSIAVAAATAAGLRVRAMGNGKSWASHVVTRDVCLRLGGLDRILAVDPVRKTVVVEAGVRLGDLTRALAAHGLCLPSLSFLNEASIGGAVATATHGTSPRWGTLSDAVRAITLVLASGEIRRLGPDEAPDLLRAARVAIGMLGVVVTVELQAVAMPWVRYAETPMTLATFLARRAAILERYEHVWVHWTVGRDAVVVKTMESRSGRTRGFHPYVTGDNAFWLNPAPVAQALRRAGRAARRLGRVLTRSAQPAPVPELEPGKVWMSMQYGVPAERLEAAVDALRSDAFASQHAGRVVELKFLKGSDHSLLGPNADGDVVLFNLWWQVEEARKHTIFDDFEAVMMTLQGRPHWGKFHAAPDRATMRRLYPGWAEFERIRDRLDPHHVFSIFAEDGDRAAPSGGGVPAEQYAERV